MARPEAYGVIVNAVLALATIAVAIVAYNIAQEANRLAEQQRELMRQQQLPIFQFKIDNVPDDQDPQVPRERIIITNIGEPVRGFKARPYGVLEVSQFEDGELRTLGLGGLESRALLPFSDYFGPNYWNDYGLSNHMVGDVGLWFGPPATDT